MFATSLLVLLIDRHGTDVLLWEPETIRLELETVLKRTPTKSEIDKTTGLISAVSGTDFYTDPAIFNHVCVAITDKAYFEVFEPATPEEIAWALTEIGLLIEKPLGKLFYPEVKKYIEETLRTEGIFHAPSCLKEIITNYFGKIAALPTMVDGVFHQAVVRKSVAESEEIDTLINDTTKKLIEELNQLPLYHRDSEQWTQMLRKIKN